MEEPGLQKNRRVISALAQLAALSGWLGGASCFENPKEVSAAVPDVAFEDVGSQTAIVESALTSIHVISGSRSAVVVQPANVALATTVRTHPPQRPSIPSDLLMGGGLSLADGESAHDFGVVPQGETRQHVFHLVSDGEEPLVIRSVKPSCGCTRAEPYVFGAGGQVRYILGSPIPVGDPLDLLVEVATENRVGDFATQVTVYENDPSDTLTLHLTANIEPVLIVEPDREIAFGTVMIGKGAHETVRVSSKHGVPFLLREQAGVARPQAVTVKLTPVEADEQDRALQWEAEVALEPGLGAGTHYYPMLLVSDLAFPTSSSQSAPHASEAQPKVYTIPLVVTAVVQGSVHAEPSFLSFGVVNPDQATERSLRVKSLDDFQLSTDMPIRILGLNGELFPFADHLSVSLRSTADGRALELLAGVEELCTEVTGSFSGILELGVGHPTMSTLSIRFGGTCQAAGAGALAEKGPVHPTSTRKR